jgi:hypothetical protein
MPKYQAAYKADLGLEEQEDENVATAEPPEQEPQDPEEASFKKRYGDLRRHMQQSLSQKDEELRKVKEQLDQAARKQIKFPKSEDEIAEWVKKYPDVAAIIDTIAQKRALEALEIGEKKMANLAQLERKIEREKAEAELMKLHPDFSEIRADKAFHDWVAEQPKWIQAALYENDTDAKAAARAIDLYKSDNKKKPGRPAKDAAQSVGRSSSSAPSGEGKGRYSESQVSKMSELEYEKHEDAILEAMKTGNFVYDLSGGAR